MTKNHYLKIFFSVLLAAVLWFVIFITRPANFWLSMAIGIFLLNLTALLFDHNTYRLGKICPMHIVVGIGSAIVLYAVFYIGNLLSAIFIPSKDALIGSVYLNKAGTNPTVIFCSLLFVIGPGEEIFWRGFIQKSLSDKLGVKAVVISAFFYTAVHIVTLNFMLIIASLVCGLFWGFLFYKEKSIYPVILSHALWDVTVFLLLPFK